MAQGIDSSDFWKSRNNDNNLNSYFICNICRLCANISDNVVPIFDKPNEKGSIYTKLKKCLPSIMVFENDMKPKQICVSCVSKLDLCVSFVDMSRDADSKFEVVLQNKLTLQANSNDSSVNSRTFSNQEISWPPMKLEDLPIMKSEEHSNKVKDEVSFSSSELLNQLYQQRTFPQQVVNTPVTVSTSMNFPPNDNAAILMGKQDVSHSILQNLLTQDTAPQDVVVLVEVKCKDMMTTSSTTMINKKADLPQNMITPLKPVTVSEANASQQTKIMDTNGHIRVINLSDFDGKFNQFDKIASSFITDEKSSSTTDSLTSNLDVSKSLLKSTLLTTITTSSDVLSQVSTTPINNMKGKSGTSTVQEFRCEICNKHFTRKNRLNAHVARHSSERPHSCDKCDQKFITRWDLTLHLRIHSGVFSCEFCGKAFPAKGKLERHRRTHTGERPFSCTLCNRAFSEKRNLKNHMKTHAATNVNSRKNSNGNCTSCGWMLNNSNNNNNNNNNNDNGPIGGTCSSCSQNTSSTFSNNLNTNVTSEQK